MDKYQFINKLQAILVNKVLVKSPILASATTIQRVAFLKESIFITLFKSYDINYLTKNQDILKNIYIFSSFTTRLLVVSLIQHCYSIPI